MNNANSNLTAVFSTMFGRQVKKGDVVLTISSLSEKLGSMRDGSKLPYMILLDKDNESVELHPEKAKSLVTKGSQGDMELVGFTQPTTAETTATAPAVDAKPAKEKKAPKEKKAAEPKEPSKKDIALSIYNDMVAQGKARKDIIAVFKTDPRLMMSDSGANTYHQNCKSIWQAAPVVAPVTAETTAETTAS